MVYEQPRPPGAQPPSERRRSRRDHGNTCHRVLPGSFPEAEQARAFFVGILGLLSVDAGGGWLIFALSPADLAVHLAEGKSYHELYLMCDDIQATLAELRAKGVEAARGCLLSRLGLLAAIRLPDGSEFPVYEPRHPSSHRA